MAWKVADRIYETSTTTGTGTYTLDGAETGFQSLTTLGAGALVPYFATDDINWEVGNGTVGVSPTTLARTTILASSNAGAAVNWGAGTKKIRVGLPANFSPRKAVETRNSNTILGHDDFGKTIVITGASTFSQTVTAAATLGDGWRCKYKNAGSGVVTLDPNGAETINGAATLAIQPGQGCEIWCNGTAFYAVLANSSEAKGLKVGNFTRDMTAATGSVAYAGVGFKPSAIIFMGGAAASNEWSIGFDDGSTRGVLEQVGSTLNTTTDVQSIRINQGAANEQYATVSSFDSDGFTLGWTKGGSPTGTATIKYIAFR